MDSNEMLDTILKALYSKYQNKYKPILTNEGDTCSMDSNLDFITDLSILSFGDGKFGEKGANEIDLALQYLEKKEMIISKLFPYFVNGIDIKERKYAITYEGLVFIENGGYVGKNNKEKIKSILQMCSSGFLLLIGLVTGLYYFQELTSDYEINQNSFFWFLIGGIVGTIVTKSILWLIKHMRKSKKYP